MIDFDLGQLLPILFSLSTASADTASKQATE